MKDRNIVVAAMAGWLLLASMERAERAANRAFQARLQRSFSFASARWRRRASQGVAVSGVLLGGAALTWSLFSSRSE